MRCKISHQKLELGYGMVKPEISLDSRQGAREVSFLRNVQNCYGDHQLPSQQAREGSLQGQSGQSVNLTTQLLRHRLKMSAAKISPLLMPSWHVNGRFYIKIHYIQHCVLPLNKHLNVFLILFIPPIILTTNRIHQQRYTIGLPTLYEL